MRYPIQYNLLSNVFKIIFIILVINDFQIRHYLG